MPQIALRVTPNARESTFAGWTADAHGRPVLLVKLAAPPVDGKANDELVRFLARALGVSRGRITLLRGLTGRQKSVELPEEALARLPK